MNYYEVLGTWWSAGDVYIRQCYLRLMKQHHPDKGGSQEQAAVINTAYGRVRTAELRRAYRKELEVKGMQECKDCGGSGYGSKNSKRRPCLVCKGSGHTH